MNTVSEDSYSKFERLLTDASILMETRREDLKLKAECLIAKAKPHFERIKQDELSTAPHFNVFDALGVVRKEVIQSRFLAYLLSPCEQHKQGAKFINAFLEEIKGNLIDESILASVKVRTEVPTDKYGRMDIVITAPDLMIVIEVKINAGERENQIADYQNWMDDQQYLNKILVFLTPDGRDPETVDPKKIRPFSLSYKELAERVFNPLTPGIVPCSVRAVVEQYVTACRLITLGEIAMTNLDADLKVLIEGNLKCALELEQQTRLVREEIAGQFCNNVQHFLIEKINSDSLWKAVKEDFTIKIVVKGKEKDLPSLGATCVFSEQPDKYSYFGWHPGWCCNQNETNHIFGKMHKKLGGRQDKNFIWQSETGVGYDLLDEEDMVKCHNDNIGDHSLAEDFSETMWDRFERCRSEIEALPCFQTATNK